MSNEIQGSSYVERIELSQDLDKRIAWASARIGEVLVCGIAIWRGGNGRLRVFFPSCKVGPGWADAVEVPAELRAQIEADVISAYKQAKAAAQAEQRQKGEPFHG